MNGLVFGARKERLVMYRHGQRFRKMSLSDARGEGNKGYTDGRQLRWRRRRRSPPRGWQVARRRGGHVVYIYDRAGWCVCILQGDRARDPRVQ